MKSVKKYGGMTGTLVSGIGLPVAGIIVFNVFLPTSTLFQIPLHSAVEGFGTVIALLLALLLLNKGGMIKSLHKQ